MNSDIERIRKLKNAVDFGLEEVTDRIRNYKTGLSSGEYSGSLKDCCKAIESLSNATLFITATEAKMKP